MNSWKKLYCRTFQAALKAALPFLPYRKPKIVGSVRDIPDILIQKRCSRVLIVTDEGIRKAGLTKRLQKALSDNGIPYSIYDKTVANPTTANVNEAMEMYISGGCNAIIGFGGGSSMDCAKALGVRIARPNSSLAKMKGILKVHKRLPLLIAIPTTAGTGSETTLAAVITDAETRHKYAINDFPLIPRYAVLDPAITASLPPALTASTGMDALTHAVEAYIGRSTTRDTREASLTAVRLIFENLDAAYADGNNLTARRNMLHASYLAGCAFTKSYVGYVHAVAHSLGGEYNTPHGLANAVLLPIGLELYGPCVCRKLWELGRSAGVTAETDSREAGAEAFIAAIRGLNRRLGIPERLPEIRREDIPVMAGHAAREANPLYPVPRLMSARELEQFYERAADGGTRS